MLQRKLQQYKTLLRVRKHLEDARARALSEARRQEDASRRERDRIAGEQQRILSDTGTALKTHFNAEDLRRYHQYERHLARMGVSKDAEIRALTSVCEEKRDALTEAMKERRIIEKLHERTLEHMETHFLKEEQKALDEIASNYAGMDINTGRTLEE